MQATDHYINRKLFCRTNSKVVHLFSNCLFGILSIEQIHNLVGWIYRIEQCGTKVNSESHAHETHVSENKTSILDIRLKGWNVRWPRRYFLDTDRATDQTSNKQIGYQTAALGFLLRTRSPKQKRVMKTHKIITHFKNYRVDQKSEVRHSRP